jgi:hypothetical protein
MQRTEQIEECQCWVDVFDAAYFMGRMRRLFGPQKMPRSNVKSVIVGPEATILLSVRSRGKDRVVELAARRVIPDLAASIKGATIRNASVVRRIAQAAPPSKKRRYRR